MKNVDINPEMPAFPISVVADILQVHHRTLRIWDEEGILIPGRSVKNRRMYSINDIEKGKLIQFMTRNLGINIISIKVIFKLCPDLNIEKIKTIADELGVTNEEMEERIFKMSKRGRKPATI